MVSVSSRGAAFAVATAAISGVSVFVNSMGVKGADPFAYTVFKNAVAGMLFIAVLVIAGDWKWFLDLSGKQRKLLSAVAIFGGCVPFLMFFYGLSIAGGPTASFLYRLLFAFSAIFAVAFLREKLDWRYAVGGVAAVSANFLLLGNAALTFGLGEALVLGATILWSFEVVMVKGLLSSVRPSVIATTRMAGGAIAMTLLLAVAGRTETLLHPSAALLSWSALTGALLFCFVCTWYAALSRIEVSKASALLAIGGPITTGISIFAGQAVSFQVAAAMALLATGLAFAAGFGETVRELAAQAAQANRIFGSRMGKR